MTARLILFMMLSTTYSYAQSPPEGRPLISNDWLIHSIDQRARVFKQDDVLIMDNGLAQRKFSLTPNASCIGYKNLTNEQELIRAVEPEAQITINGKTYDVGGLKGQKEKAYLLPQWLPGMSKCEEDFMYDK